MFDWDKDYDGLIASGPTKVESDAQPELRASSGPSRQKVLILAAALLCAGLMWSSFTSTPHRIAGLAQSSFIMPLPFSAPLEMQILDQDQRARFQAGLRVFSAPDLVQYGTTTRADLNGAAVFMQPYLADALALIEHELARRGM